LALSRWFQIISHRYERGATLITTNRVYKHWAGIFNNDAVLTSALLDRVMHHVQTVLIEGKSYRSKNQVELQSAVALMVLGWHVCAANYRFGQALADCKNGLWVSPFLCPQSANSCHQGSSCRH